MTIRAYSTPETGEANTNSPVIKALALLEGVVASEEPVALARLAAAHGLPKPTAHRLALMLEREGYLHRAPGSRRFVVGRRLIVLALDVLRAAVRQGPSRAILAALSEEVGETCSLGMIVGHEVALVDHVKMGAPLILDVGGLARLPMHCTAMGKLLLSFLPPPARERLIDSLTLERFTGATITDRKALLAELARIRASRVALNDQEYIPGVIAVAVPVMGPRGQVCASVAVAGPEARISRDQALKFVPALERAAARLAACFAADG